MSREYIPRGMLEKQYRWEIINHQLYYYLLEANHYSELKNMIKKLIKLEEMQLLLIQQLADTFGIHLHFFKQKAENSQDILTISSELYDREYQLLQEYMSYSAYFLPIFSGINNTIKELIENQMSQVNFLSQIKNTLLKVNDDYQQIAQDKELTEKISQNYYLEEGYQLKKVVDNLNFPTDITFDDDGNIYIAEAGFAYGTEPGEGRILKLDKSGTITVLAEKFSGPLTGITYNSGYIYTAEGGRGEKEETGCGKIARIDMDGTKEILVANLRTCGDHFTGDVRFGPDGKLYFSVGTATNSAVVGPDNLPWLRINPNFHDVPARNFHLNGKNYLNINPLSKEQRLSLTGAFKPFDMQSYDGELVKGSHKSNGIICNVNLDGSDLQIVADGFRNPFGIRFSPFNGKMYVTDNGADNRGNRPINRDWDNFWEVTPKSWHGWPDFFSGLPVTLPHFHVENKIIPAFVIRNHPKLASQPTARFKFHSSSDKFDFSTNPSFGYVGKTFVAQLGNMGMEEKSGFKVVRLDINTGQIKDFLVNPLGEDNLNGPIRPVAAVFNPDGAILYIVDFGKLTSKNKRKTGALWKIVKSRSEIN